MVSQRDGGRSSLFGDVSADPVNNGNGYGTRIYIYIYIYMQGPGEVGPGFVPPLKLKF